MTKSLRNPWRKRAVEFFTGIRKDVVTERAESMRTDPETVVVDLLADLRHLCDVHEFDFAALDKAAYTHYIEEARAKYDRKLKTWVTADGITYEGDVIG